MFDAAGVFGAEELDRGSVSAAGGQIGCAACGEGGEGLGEVDAGGLFDEERDEVADGASVDLDDARAAGAEPEFDVQDGPGDSQSAYGGGDDEGEDGVGEQGVGSVDAVCCFLELWFGAQGLAGDGGDPDVFGVVEDDGLDADFGARYVGRLYFPRGPEA